MTTEHLQAITATRAALGETSAWGLRAAAELAAVGRLSTAQPQRIAVERVQLSGRTLRVQIRLQVKTPRQPDAAGALRYADAVEIGLTLPPDILTTDLPGTSFAEILNPGDVFLPNVLSEPAKPQIVCLGVLFPRGQVTLEDLVLRLYDTLRGQHATFRGDPAGILNAAASRYFEARPDLLPTTPTPFFSAPGAAA